jgi:hypothetical protein
MAGADTAAMLKFRDTIRKEVSMIRHHQRAAAAGVGDDFTLNPKSLKPVAATIGTVTARKVTAEETASFERDVVRLRADLAASRRTPQEKTDAPVTAMSDYGWYSTPEWTARISRPYSMATHTMSEIVAFGDEYRKKTGTGPFNKVK